MANALGLQQIFNRHLDDYCQHHRLDARRAQVCNHIRQCRTEALGGLQMQCDHCDHGPLLYFACRDRHCPLCQQRASRQWAQKQQQAVLPVTYYHLVFTLPDTLHGWAQLHPEVIYQLLFKAAWATLKTFALDPKRLGGELGMTAVLHTWGQTLVQHVHLHCLVPGGALSPEGQWKAARSNYLFPVRALSRHFRGCLVSHLRQAAQAGKLPRVTDASEPRHTLDCLMNKDWVVYTKPCVVTAHVVEYLGRYSHRTAIGNGRILAMEDDEIRFRYKDYRDHDRRKVLALTNEEFIRRFLLHVLPKGLMRIRHYGFLANCCREHKLALVRSAIAAEGEAKPAQEVPKLLGIRQDGYSCPRCGKGHLRVIAELPPKRREGG